MSTEKDTVHIACAVDDSFAYPLSVMLISLLENNKINKIKIHLFSAKLSRTNIDSLEILVRSYDQSFMYYQLEDSKLKEFPTNERISLASYYRILIPEFIEESVERFLYLDADIIVLGDLSPLNKIELNNKTFAAVDDVNSLNKEQNYKHNIPFNLSYFNAGVLLINRLKWISNKSSQKVFKYIINNREKCSYHDQDGLNATLYTDRTTLEPKWNQQIGLFFYRKEYLLKHFKQHAIDDAINNPIIVHFNGSEKPWNYVSGHVYTKDFKYYAKKINGFDYSEKVNLKKVIRKYFIFGVIGWKRFNSYFYNK